MKTKLIAALINARDSFSLLIHHLLEHGYNNEAKQIVNSEKVLEQWIKTIKMTIDDTLIDRGKLYGDFKDNARVSQALKAAMPRGHLPGLQREAIDMILHKIARIVNGRADYIDNWRDIAGYAQLIMNDLQKTDGAIDSETRYFMIET